MSTSDERLARLRQAITRSRDELNRDDVVPVMWELADAAEDLDRHLSAKAGPPPTAWTEVTGETSILDLEPDITLTPLEADWLARILQAYLLTGSLPEELADLAGRIVPSRTDPGREVNVVVGCPPVEDTGPSQAVWTPWASAEHAVIGWRVTDRPQGRQQYVYFNPSDTSGAAEGESPAPNTFVYVGPHGDPALDWPVCYVDVLQFIDGQDAEPTVHDAQ